MRRDKPFGYAKAKVYEVGDKVVVVRPGDDEVGQPAWTLMQEGVVTERSSQGWTRVRFPEKEMGNKDGWYFKNQQLVGDDDGQVFRAWDRVIDDYQCGDTLEEAMAHHGFILRTN